MIDNFKYLINLVVFAMLLLLVACEDNENITESVLVSDIKSESNNALTNNIEFKTSIPTEATVRYWKDGDSEESALEVKADNNDNYHTAVLFALNEDQKYNYKIITNYVSNEETYQFVTDTMPLAIKNFYKESENIINDNLDGYYMFNKMTYPSCCYIINNKGKVVWYKYDENIRVKVNRISKRNTLLTMYNTSMENKFAGNAIKETNFKGETIFNYVFPTKTESGYAYVPHHCVNVDSYDNYVIVIRKDLDDSSINGFIVMDKNKTIIKEWLLDDYLDRTPFDRKWEGKSAPKIYINSISFDENGNYLISIKGINEVWKIDVNTSEVIWRIGEFGDISISDNALFSGQHYAYYLSENEMMLFDNGIYEKKSRIISFKINEDNRSAELNINSYLPDSLYTPYMGNAMLLSDENIITVSAKIGTILKMNKSGDVLWSLKTGGRIYRVGYIDNPFINN